MVRTKIRDLRVGCSLCQAAGHCICHDEDLVWIDFERRPVALNLESVSETKGKVS
jgi:hypothetical protein